MNRWDEVMNVIAWWWLMYATLAPRNPQPMSAYLAAGSLR